MRLYVLFDAAVQRAVNGPITLYTDEEAKRTALRACCDPTSNIHQSPEDYVLYCVAEFVPEDCTVHPLNPEVVVSSSEFLSAVRHYQRSQHQIDEE